MIRYMDIAGQVDVDFTRAVRGSLVYRVGTRTRGDSSSFRTPSFGEAERPWAPATSSGSERRSG
jgi:hypothetical protein